MALSDTLIRIHRASNAPPVPITFPNVDLTGSVIELVLTPASGGSPVTLTTEEAGLTLAPPNGLVWEYTEELAAALPTGRRTYFDLYRVQGDTREKIGAGTVVVESSGAFGRAEATQIEVPGLQGRPGEKGEGGDKGDPGDRKSVV